MIAKCTRCGKDVQAHIHNQTPEEAMRDLRLELMHVPYDSKEGDHFFDISLSDDPDVAKEQIDGAFQIPHETKSSPETKSS